MGRTSMIKPWMMPCGAVRSTGKGLLCFKKDPLELNLAQEFLKTLGKLRLRDVFSFCVLRFDHPKVHLKVLKVPP